MQTRKQHIEETILSKAEAEFFQYGFEKASVRRIVQAAGTSIGNFYNYFENKEALFDALVREEHSRFLRFISEHNEAGRQDFDPEWLKSEEFLRHLPDMMEQYMPKLSIRFVLLLECSKGTKFESTYENLVEILKNHLKEHRGGNTDGLDNELDELLARQFIDGIVRIVRNNQGSNHRIHQLLASYLIFYITGIMHLQTSDPIHHDRN